MQQETTTIVKYRGLTNPLTCCACGKVIERGTPMSWRRETPVRKFWHTGCVVRKRGAGKGGKVNA